MAESNRRKSPIRRPPPSESINFSPASSTSHQISKISVWLRVTGEKSGGIAQKSTKSSLTLSTDSKRLNLVTGLCLAVLPELGREVRAFLLPGPPLG